MLQDLEGVLLLERFVFAEFELMMDNKWINEMFRLEVAYTWYIEDM